MVPNVEHNPYPENSTTQQLLELYIQKAVYKWFTGISAFSGK